MTPEDVTPSGIRAAYVPMMLTPIDMHNYRLSDEGAIRRVKKLTEDQLDQGDCPGFR